MPTVAERLANLFRGSKEGHGTFGQPEKETKPSGVKWGIKTTARTKRIPPTLDLFQKHIEGTYPLGIIPITERGGCYFGAIDVDDYSVNPLDIISRIDSGHYPLIPTLSKSGGLHLFLFCQDEQPASLVQNVLNHFAAKLGLAGSEIFPKQTQVLSERGDLGNWIALPLLGTTYEGKFSEQTGVKKTGARMTPEEFLTVCEKARVTTEDLVKYEQETERKKKPTPTKDKVIKLVDVPFADGPPCLEHLSSQGVPDGGRNNTLFMMGLYYIRVEEATWKQRLEDANRQFFNPPLDSAEILKLIQSIEKKGGRDQENGYRYTCKASPMSSHCNSKLCRGRRYGIGSAEETPKISGITRMNSDPPIWFVNVNDVRIEASTDQLQNYYRFQALCLDRGTMFRTMKQADWIGLLGDAISQGVDSLDVPSDVGIAGQFKELLDEFLTDRQIAEDKEELLRNLPWRDEEKQRIYFKLAALQGFLEKQNFKHYTRGKLVSKIKDLGGDHGFFTLKGNRGLNVWYIPFSALPDSPSYNLPELKKGPI